MSSLQRFLAALAAVAGVTCGELRTVQPLPLPRVSRIAICCIPPRYAGLNVGSELPLFVFAFDSAGDTLGVRPDAPWWHGGVPGQPFSAEWWSSDSSVAGIDPLGVVLSRHIGRTYLHARTVSVRDTLVDSVPLAVIDVHPASKSPAAP